jgi:hypothetical protein
VKNAQVGFTTAPYRQLSDVKEGDSESAGDSHEYSSSAGKNRIEAGEYSAQEIADYAQYSKIT